GEGTDEGRVPADRGERVEERIGGGYKRARPPPRPRPGEKRERACRGQPKRRLRVAAGNRTVNPSSSSVMMIWQPSRDVLVRLKARSGMSSSSSLASFSRSYQSGSTMM